MGAPKQPSHITQVNETKLPAFIEQGGQQNLAIANDIANNLMPAYSGNMVAGLNNDQFAAFDMARASSAVGQPAMQAGLSSLNRLANYNPLNVGAQQTQAPAAINAQQIGANNVTAQQIGARDVNAQNTTAQNWLTANRDAYMNPYTQQVIDSSMAVLNQQGKQALNGIGDNAALAGAFGGGRHGVAEGIQASQTALQGAQLNAQLQDQNWRQAQAQFNTDSALDWQNQTNNANRSLDASKTNAANWLQANLANQNAALQADTSNANRALTAAQSNQAATLDADKTNAQFQFQNATNNADRVLTADRSNQTAGLQAQQNATDAASKQLLGGQLATQTWLQSAAAQQAVGDSLRAYDQDLLNQDAARYDAVRNFPLEQLGIRQSALAMTPYGQTTTTTQTNPNAGGSGAMGILGGIGSIATALLPLFMLSDERTKTNKKKLGTDPATGADLYSYEYKGDPTKRVGPMAQDLEKKVPGSVVKGPDGLKRIHPAVSDTPAQQGLRAITGAKGPKPGGLGIGGGMGKGLLSDEGTKTSSKAPAKKKKLSPKKVA